MAHFVEVRRDRALNRGDPRSEHLEFGNSLRQRIRPFLIATPYVAQGLSAYIVVFADLIPIHHLDFVRCLPVPLRTDAR